MKNFLRLFLKIFLTSIVLSLLVYSFALNFKIFKVNENNYYNLFTNIHNGSFIAGTSRSRYFFDNRSFDANYNFRNYSFSVGMSPYNNSYTDFLIKFIQQDSLKENITILSVDPYSFPDNSINQEEYFSKFEFKRDDFKKINLEYILKEKITPITIFEENIKSLLRSYIYGKNHIKDNRSISEIEILNKISQTEKPNVLNYKALKNLEKLIFHFKKSSNVILVRTPVINEFYEFENTHSLKFNFKMDSLANKHKIKYLDLNKSKKVITNKQFYDLYHLNKKYSKEYTTYSMKIIDSIITASK